jgi:hypothetical protein
MLGLMTLSPSAMCKVAPFPKLSPLSSVQRTYLTDDVAMPSSQLSQLSDVVKANACSGTSGKRRSARTSDIKMMAVKSWYDEGTRIADAPKAATAAPTSVAADAGMPYPTAMLEALGGYDVETGGGIWDPLKIAAQPDADLKWFRQAEIKHGRIAMLACVGYVVAKCGVVFPGLLARDGTQFADLVQSNPFLEWDAVPLGGKLQATLAAAAIELNAEQKAIEGGKIGEMPVLKAWLPWIPDGEAPSPEAEAKRKQSLISELKNGRLAMIGIVGFYASETIPGSVPFHF